MCAVKKQALVPLAELAPCLFHEVILWVLLVLMVGLSVLTGTQMMSVMLQSVTLLFSLIVVRVLLRMIFRMKFCLNGYDEVICIVEYSFSQFIGVCGSIMDFCDQKRFPSDLVEKMRIVLEDPDENGVVKFHLGFPRVS